MQPPKSYCKSRTSDNISAVASEQAPPLPTDAERARSSKAETMHSRQTASTDISGSAAGLVCEPRECDKSSRDLSHIDIEALKRSIVSKISERTRLNRQQLFVDAYQRGDATLAVAEVINTRTHGVVDMVNVEGDLVQALLRLHERVVARRQ